MSNFKEQLHKKSLVDIEAMIVEQKRKMTAEKDLTVLTRLSFDLGVLHEVRDQKLKESSHFIHRSAKSPEKQDLKSFDDYVKSKK